MRQLTIHQETWPTKGTFRIARGARTEVHVIVVGLNEAGNSGFGECVPYSRYNESIDSVCQQIEAVRPQIESGVGFEQLIDLLPPGAARNALDLALWDLNAKQQDKPVWEIAGLDKPKEAFTAFTISLADPKEMEVAAHEACDRPLLKIKLGGSVVEKERDRLHAVRSGAPDARLIIDANEGWDMAMLEAMAPRAASLGVELIEQPLPAASDSALESFKSPVPLGADESFHDLQTLAQIRKKYQAVNLKLDKAGGLTTALHVLKAAQQENLDVMIGCMVATSLAMAPALLLAGDVKFVDLDGPLLLDRDRVPGLRYEGSKIFPTLEGLWGMPN